MNVDTNDEWFPTEILEEICKFIGDPNTFLNFSLACKNCFLITKYYEKQKKAEFIKTYEKNSGWGGFRRFQTLPNQLQHGKHQRWYHKKGNNNNIRAFCCDWTCGKMNGLKIRWYENGKIDQLFVYENNIVVKMINFEMVVQGMDGIAVYIYIGKKDRDIESYVLTQKDKDKSLKIHTNNI